MSDLFLGECRVRGGTLKTISQEWKKYRKNKIPPDINPDIIDHLKVVYYAGAMACLEISMQDCQSYAEFQEIMRSITDDLGSLATEIIARKSTIH
jgi:hypothetical protein